MPKRSNSGFSLIELIIVMLIVSILTSIALPAYNQYMVRSRRAAAEACLSNLASYMERFYATNMRYDQDSAGTAMNTATLTAVNLECTTASNTGQYYGYSLTSTASTQSTYELTATPKGTQLAKDTKCGTLTINQAGLRGRSGSGVITDCWPH